ncbi:MAG: hypothetical protein Q8936_06625 [Bacillota bacterium]|nr:hypothetical protein [Bacillota bacterium]
MKVIIMKCEDKSNYKDKIGKVYKVMGQSETTYFTKEGLFIKKSDCEIVEK